MGMDLDRTMSIEELLEKLGSDLRILERFPNGIWCAQKIVDLGENPRNIFVEADTPQKALEDLLDLTRK